MEVPKNRNPILHLLILHPMFYHKFTYEKGPSWGMPAL